MNGSTDEGPPAANKNAGTQTILRIVDILGLTASQGAQGASTAAIADRLGLSRATAHRMVKALRDAELLRRDPVDGRLRIGRLVWELGLGAVMEIEDGLALRPTVDAVARRTGHTAYLLARHGLDSVCIYRAEGRSVLSAIPVEPGQRRALGLGTGGVAMLSAYDPSEIARIVRARREAFDSIPGLTEERVIALAMAAKPDGLVVSHANFLPGVTGIGLLVPCRPNDPRFAVTIAAPSASLTAQDEQRVRKVLRSEVLRE